MSRSIRPPRRVRQRRRRGATVVLVLFLMVMMLACVAFCIDLGYLAMARTELQRSADSAAMAAVWELVDESLLQGELSETALEETRDKAKSYAGKNRVCTKQPDVDLNAGNSKDGDVVLGTVWNVKDHSEQIKTEEEDGVDAKDYNVVRVRVRRTSGMNGNVPFFFAPIWGISGSPAEANATAGIVRNIMGFRAPDDGSNLGVLPFALDLETWNALQAAQQAGSPSGVVTDSWSWDSSTKTFSPGADGVYEVNLYPQDTGMPGNRGTVDIGGSNNSTDDIKRQVLEGVSPQDLQDLGKPLELDENGELTLNGDTGISDGVKEELASIKGESKIIPIYSQVESPGNNAIYTIVMFVGVRIMDVKLTGSNNSKRVIIQPANAITKGVIPASAGSSQTSYFVYSYPFLIR